MLPAPLASCSTPTICSSVKRVRFMEPPPPPGGLDSQPTFWPRYRGARPASFSSPFEITRKDVEELLDTKPARILTSTPPAQPAFSGNCDLLRPAEGPDPN